MASMARKAWRSVTAASKEIAASNISNNGEKRRGGNKYRDAKRNRNKMAKA